MKEASQAYGDDPRQQLDAYWPTPVADDAPVVVFFYGNGWREAARADFEFVASALTAAGILVLIPDYRAHPQVTFPAFVEDGAAAVRWAVANIPGVADAARPLYLMGHSAGAPPTLMVHGTSDRRVLPEHSRRLARRLEEEGVPVMLRMYDGTGHARVVAALAPPLQFIAATLDDVTAFIGRHRAEPTTLEYTYLLPRGGVP